jgi:hypothetical protein
MVEVIYMRRLIWTLVTLMVMCGAAQSLTPRVFSVEERVQQSTHIFVGTVHSIYYADRAGAYLTPEQAQRQSAPNILYRVRVQEVLFPYNLRPAGYTTVQIQPPLSWATSAMTLRQLKYQLGTLAQQDMRKSGIFFTRYAAQGNEAKRLTAVALNQFPMLSLEAKRYVQRAIYQHHKHRK